MMDVFVDAVVALLMMAVVANMVLVIEMAVAAMMEVIVLL